MVLLPIHIMGGLVGIASGYVAMLVLKGGGLHRQSGMVFVYAMLTMASTGVVLSLMKPHGWGTALGGVLAGYMVASGLLTVRRDPARTRWIDVATMTVAVMLAVTYFTFGMQARASVDGRRDGYPAMLYFVFGSITWLAAFGDIRMLARGLPAMQGSRRIARHLWRMCFALFIATGSFFLGQAKVLPKSMRVFPLLAITVFVVLLLMFYWLARVRFSRALRQRYARASAVA
jgi:hypothetical protein